MIVNVAPCWALRTAGLPFDVIDRRVFDYPISLLRDLEILQLEVSRAGDELADCLHDVISRIAGKSDLSRDLLKLRRDAHNNRMPSLSLDRSLPRIRDVLTLPERQLLDHWMTTLNELASAWCSYNREVEVAVDIARKAYRDALKCPEILRGLAIASPTLCLALLNEKGSARPAKQRRLERSIVLYVNRISRKISPLSTLTTVITQSQEGTAQTTGDSVIDVAPALQRAILDTLAMYETAPVLTLQGPAYTASSPCPEACARILLPVRSCFDDFFYAEDVTFDLPRRLETITSERTPHTVAEWLQILGCTPWSLAELIAEGVLIPNFSFSDLNGITIKGRRDVDTPFVELASILEAQSSLADARPEERAKSVLQLKERAQKFVAVREGVAPSWMETAPLVHETCATEPQFVPLIPQQSLRQAMADVAEVIRPTIARSFFYDSLLQAFQALSGSTGRLPLVDFVSLCISSSSMVSITARAMRQDFQRAEWIRMNNWDEEVCCDGRGTLAPATFTAFLQPFGAGSDSWSMAVLNRVNQGPGGLLVRWGNLPGCDRQLAENYTPWLQGLHPEARIAALTTGDSWAGVQRIPEGVVPRLVWPTSACVSARNEDDVLAADLDVVFDSRTDTLQVVFRPTGQPVALPYLGVIPQHLLRGSGKILHALTDPWVYDFRVGLEAADTLSKPEKSIDVVPRRVSGSVVVRRRSWRVNTQTMPLAQCRANSDAKTLLAEFHRWSSHHGIPRRVYAKAADSLSGTLRRNKPQFVDLADPFTLDLLVKLASEVSLVILEEALPDDNPWWPIEGEAPRSMEITAVMALGSGNKI